MTWAYFVSLLALACGDLIIDIDIDMIHDEAVIDVRGNIAANIISDTERKTFGIEDEQLKKAVEIYTKDGTKPDYVYVKPGEKDLYANRDWLKVKRYVTPTYLDLKPTINCKSVGVAPTNMAITTDWTIKDYLTVTDKINHIVYFDGNKILSTENSEWGKNKSIQIPIKVEAGYKYEECVMNVELEYETTIAGDVTADYTKKRTTTKEDSHHFWAYDLKNVQKAAKLKNSIVTTEIINVTYFKKEKI